MALTCVKGVSAWVPACSGKPQGQEELALMSQNFTMLGCTFLAQLNQEQATHF